jgi:hypothetical protein
MTAPREKTTKKQAKLHVGLALLEFARECTKDIPLGEFEKLRKDGAKTAQRRRKDGAKTAQISTIITCTELRNAMIQGRSSK